MDGKGRWADNIFMERWFRSLKQECIYINEYKNIKELKQLIKDYIDYYNNTRIHEALNYETPASWYYSGINSASMELAA